MQNKLRILDLRAAGAGINSYLSPSNFLIWLIVLLQNTHILSSNWLDGQKMTILFILDVCQASLPHFLNTFVGQVPLIIESIRTTVFLILLHTPR